MDSKRPRIVIRVKGVKQQRKSAKQKIAVWNFVIIAALIVLFYAFTSAKAVPFTEQEISELKDNSYTVQVPYIEKEFYQEKVHYGNKYCRPVSYDVNESYTSEYKILETPLGEKKWHLICTLAVFNKEEKAGNFSYYALFNKKFSYVERGALTKEIAALSSETFVWAFEMENFGDVISCTPRVYKAPTLERCTPIDLSQFMYVTQYRNVTKYRNETVYQGNTEKLVQNGVKYVNRLFGYSQFFYLGY